MASPRPTWAIVRAVESLAFRYHLTGGKFNRDPQRSGREATMFGNWFKTSLLMAAIMALFGMVGAVLGGAQGILLALALGLATNLWAYWFSDTMVLNFYGA